MGPDWRGIHDFDPVRLSRERIIQFCNDLDTQAIRDIFPVGSVRHVAAKFKGFIDAGMRVFKVMDYGGMAGAKFAAQVGRQGARSRRRSDAPVRGYGMIGKLNAGELLAVARQQTGLADWGDGSFEQRFGLAIKHINRIQMDDAGRREVSLNCHWLLDRPAALL